MKRLLQWAAIVALFPLAAIFPANGAYAPTTAWNLITSGTSPATLLMGTGGSLSPSGTGTINANKINGNTVPLSQALIGTDGSGHIIDITPASAIAALNSGTANAQTGTTYTYVIGDANGEVTASNTGAQTYTVPPNSSVAYAVGTLLTTQAINTGIVSITPGSGVTLCSPDYGCSTSQTYSLGGKQGFIQLQQSATNTWNVLVWYPAVPTIAFTGTCTNSASTGNGVAGDITMSSAGNCTIIGTITGGKVPLNFYMGLMCDLAQPTIPCWGPTTKTTGALTWTVPTAVSSSDHVEYGPIGYY